MRRAISALLLAASFLAPAPPAARAQDRPVTSINGIGLIDYDRPPRFEVGQWVRYHVTGESATGYTDDYVVTVAIVGEERFWGEDCFWVETQTEHRDKPGSTLATLMSYDIFKDPKPIPHMQMFMRKTVTEIDDDGEPVQNIMKRPAESLRIRDKQSLAQLFHRDTLGPDTLSVPAGHFQVNKLRIRQGSSTSADGPDSTQYTEMRETRVVHMSDRIPVTGIVREDIDYTLKRRTWLIGRSADTEFVTLEHSQGSATLVGWGQGYESVLLPPAMRRSLRQIDAAAKGTARPAAGRTPARR
jgi:hypothetical protein